MIEAIIKGCYRKYSWYTGYMSEKIKTEHTPDKKSRKDALKITTKESVDERNEILQDLKLAMLEIFGTEKMPSDLIREFGEIKSLLRDEIEGREYLESIEEFKESIELLVFKVAKHREIKDGVIDMSKLVSISDGKDGNLHYVFEDDFMKNGAGKTRDGLAF